MKRLVLTEMTMRRHLVVLTGLVLSLAPAAADPQGAFRLTQGPLQLPGSSTAPPPASPAQPRPPAQPPAAARSPAVVPGSPPPTPGPAAGAVALTAGQRSLVERANGYFNTVQSMIGDFVQVGPDGTRQSGKLFLQKPGRVRFQYNPPSVVELIADGSSVVVRDRKLNTQDLYPLSQTPLRYLLADRINLLRDANVVQVRSDDTFVTIVLEERSAAAGTNRLALFFGAQDFILRQWTVTDAQGFDTTVAVSNVDTSRRPDPALFRIDYTRNLE
jgi:outer membrane lipoprotein-sorting protein